MTILENFYNWKKYIYESTFWENTTSSRQDKQKQAFTKIHFNKQNASEKKRHIKGKTEYLLRGKVKYAADISRGKLCVA